MPIAQKYVTGGVRSDSGIRLVHTAYVPRVVVSGLYRLADKSTSTVTVSGRGTPHGRITFHGDGRITGRLGGHRLALKASAARASAPHRWPLRLPPFPALRRG